MKGKRTEVTAVHKKTGEQIKFSSLTDASKYLKVSKMQLSISLPLLCERLQKGDRDIFLYIFIKLNILAVTL